MLYGTSGASGQAKSGSSMLMSVAFQPARWSGSRAWRRCRSRGVPAFPGKTLQSPQLATAASMGRVSSLTSLLVARVV